MVCNETQTMGKDTPETSGGVDDYNSSLDQTAYRRVQKRAKIMKTHSPPVSISDNIFADLNIPNAEEELQKAQLAHSIRTIIEANGLTQREAAQQMKTSQPKVFLLVGGKLAGFSSERLFNYLRALECDIEIRITKKQGHRPHGLIKVVCDI